MLGCGLEACLETSSTRRSRYQLHFHCPWCTDILTDRRSALTHYSSRHDDLCRSRVSTRRSQSSSSSSAAAAALLLSDERTENSAKRFKPNGRLRTKEVEANWKDDEVRCIR